MYGFCLGLVDGYVCHKCCIKLHVCGGGVAICCLPGLPPESFPTDLSKHAKFFLWFLNSHFLGGWVPDPPPQKVRINSDNGNFSDDFPETAQIPLARKPY